MAEVASMTEAMRKTRRVYTARRARFFPFRLRSEDRVKSRTFF
jgi:hypothetical protein